MTDLREIVARAIYEAMYAKDGDRWSAVETKDVWHVKADAVLAAIRASGRLAPEGEIAAAERKVIDLAMNQPFDHEHEPLADACEALAVLRIRTGSAS